jgi:hypothetical protein
MNRDAVALSRCSAPRPPMRAPAILGLAAALLAVAAARAAASDFACSACAHDSITHLWSVSGNPMFERPETINEHCTAIEYPIPFFSVSADGTQSSKFQVTRVKLTGGFCSTTEDPYAWPQVYFVDANGFKVNDPDPATYGIIEMNEQRSDHMYFDYTHPTKGPGASKQSRTITVAIDYEDQDEGGRERVSTFQIHVVRLPVVMTHGLWADRSSFLAMEDDFTKQAKLYPKELIYRTDYQATHDAAFATNDRDVRVVENGIDTVLEQAATDGQIAAGMVNLVGHSMGGILSRLYTQGPYYHHDVFRIVTCNTPHSGSQMANLLLDEVWDPNGFLCGLIEGSGTGSCYNGAVCDLNVSSYGIHNLLNKPQTYPGDVQVHAVSTVFDIEAHLPGASVAAFVRSSWPYVPLQLQPSCSVPDLVAGVFNGDDCDLVVALESQAGGLQGDLTSVYPDQIHVGSVANQAVIDEVKRLLDEPTPNSSFTLAGFNPANLNYFSPTRCTTMLTPDFGGIFHRSAACVTANRHPDAFAARALSSPALAITSPADGTAWTSGQNMSVSVVGDAGIVSIILLLSAPGGDTYLAKLPGPAAVFDEQIPLDLVGERVLTALGVDANGSPVAVSNAVTLEIGAPATLQSISVYPSSVYLSSGGTESLQITGTYDDAVPRDLSDVSGMTYAFAQGHASHTGTNGVTLNDQEDDTLTITYQGVASPSVPIHAMPPLPPAARALHRHLGRS